MLEGLRSDAFQIRLCVLLALGQYVFSASSVGASVNAHRAVATYSAMLVRLTAFIQEYSTPAVPQLPRTGSLNIPRTLSPLAKLEPEPRIAADLRNALRCSDT